MGTLRYEESDDIAVNVSRELSCKLHIIRDLWIEMGLSSDQQALRMAAILGDLSTVLDEVASKERAGRDDLLQSIDRHRHQIELLCVELQLPVPPEGSDAEGKTSMLQLEKELQLREATLAAEKVERIDRFKRLCDADQRLRASLGMELAGPSAVDGVPTNDQLAELDAHVKKLCCTADERSQHFLTDRAHVVRLYEELECEPSSEFEQDVRSKDLENFVLSAVNMEALRDLCERLATQHRERLSIGQTLCERLRTLWQCLELPNAELDDVLRKHSCTTLPGLDALRSEIVRCEELRVDQVRHSIETIREELRLWWGKCYYSDKQRAAFTGMGSDAFGEELLRSHEAELQKAQAYYEENKKLLQKLERWDELWKLKLELVSKERDPARLENRGGVLLDEEEERRRITLLPKAEEKLKEDVKAWEASHGRIFLCNGVKFVNLCRQRREEYDRRREEEKQQRLQRRRTATPGSPMYLT